MKTEILELIKKSMDKQNVSALSYPTIDKLCLKYYPSLVFENKLVTLLNELLLEKLIKKSDKGGIILTDEGLSYLKESI